MPIKSDNCITIALIFLISLSFTILFSYPTILINDDWITANQLAQLDEGSQLLITEGKYGAFENKTPFKYFTYRHNLLPYSLFLPVLSYYPLQAIKMVGNFYPYLITTIFSIILLIIGYLIRVKNNKIKIIGNLVIVCSIILYYLNIFFARPIYITAEDASREILAIVTVHHISLALLCTFFYLIFHKIYKDFSYSCLGTIICLSCSSFLFWASNLKDHVEETLVFVIIIYFIVDYIINKKIEGFVYSFIFSGILIWIRPEFGTFIFFGLFFYFLLQFYKVLSHIKIPYSKLIKYSIILLIPFFTSLGLIPYLLNNFLITGHPLVPVWLYPSLHPEMIISNTSIIESSPSFGLLSNNTHQGPINNSIINLLYNRLIPSSDNIITNFFQIGFYPNILSVPIFLVTPLFIIGGLSIIFLYIFKFKKITRLELQLIVFLIIMIFFGFFAYISSFSGLISSLAMLPDIRYLSPLYFPLNLIGLIFLKPLLFHLAKEITKVFFCLFCIGFILIIFLIQNIQIFNVLEITIQINSLFLLCMYCAIVLNFIIMSLTILKMLDKKWLIHLIATTICLVLLWQISLILSLNLNPYWEGYPMVLPIMQYLCSLL